MIINVRGNRPRAYCVKSNAAREGRGGSQRRRKRNTRSAGVVIPVPTLPISSVNPPYRDSLKSRLINSIHHRKISMLFRDNLL